MHGAGPGRVAAVLALAGVAVFWVALFVAGDANPGYSQRRDYVSALAARGVEQRWVGTAAILAVAVAAVGAAGIVRSLTRSGAVTFLAAAVGYLVVAFVPIHCSDGAARCGLGGRFDVQGTRQVTHWTAAVTASLLVFAGLVVVGAELARRRRRRAAAATLGAAGATLVGLLATGGESPGTVQRLWILVVTAWLVAAACWRLGLKPRLAQAGSIEGPQDDAYDEERHLVERRERAERGETS